MICISRLSVVYEKSRALRDIDLTLTQGRPMAVIGESGAGKTSLALALMGMSKARVSGRIDVDGFLVTEASEVELRRYRGYRAAMVFQHLSDVLNPKIRVIRQVMETVLAHGNAHGIKDQRAAREKVKQVLVQFMIPEYLHERYPHQLSGGQIQRILLAMAMVNDPGLLTLQRHLAKLTIS